LDKETSGLLLVARTDRAHRVLGAALGRREVVRRYAALSWGHLAADRLTVDKPLGRDPNDRKRMAVVADGRAAKTTFYRLARFDAVDLLRALLDSGHALPRFAGIVSATAPLARELAEAAEARFGVPVQEVFGSTETCVIAHRRTAHEDAWTPYVGVTLHPQPDGTRVEAPQLVQPVVLSDIVELLPDGRYRLCGRNTDLLEIAGKRASLGDLTHKLLRVPGVRDGVVFQLDETDAMGVRRIAALVVAPGLDAGDILADLRRDIDAVFLPRPLKLVAALPRSETGKLPRAELLAALAG
jgi:acyl-coenzyme A synthetase/AMP-(fatty) acid ligase